MRALPLRPRRYPIAMHRGNEGGAPSSVPVISDARARPRLRAQGIGRAQNARVVTFSPYLINMTRPLDVMWAR